MLQLTYISSAASNLPATALADILRASRPNNAASGITGLLLFDGRRFLQAIEGEPVLVRRTYDRIKADPRHRAVVLLSSNEVASRAFGDWAMAGRQVAPAGDAALVELVERMTEGVADPTMQALFRGFAAIRAAA